MFAPLRSWTALPRLDVSDDMTSWRYQWLGFGLRLVFDRQPFLRAPTCPACLLPLAAPVFETPACPHPGHPATMNAA